MKRIAVNIIFLLSTLYSVPAAAQICSGTLNTVWKDDFGTGAPQLSPAGSPYITAGYLYANNGVNSGNYAIVNRFDYFGSWHVVPEDHTTGDTNGYFLVIDGNGSAPIFYDVLVNNICPNTRYSFSTAAMNIDLPAFPSGQTFTFIISDATGTQLATWSSPPIAVSNTPVWNELGFNFLSGNNTSLRLQVKFNETGYDDFAFDDFQFSICGPTLSISSPFVNNTCSDTIALSSSLGSGYTTPVYQWQKRNALGVFVDMPGATNPDFIDRSLSDSNSYRLVVGDGSLSCPIIAEKILVKSCIASTCNNWLHIPNSQSYATVGEIDIPGTQITVEGIFRRDSALTPEGYTSLNIVSKHWTPADVNYLLRVDRAQVTTTNGHFQTPDICELKNKKIYHAAMTYDGATLKFYQNGFLMSQIPCTGTMFQNDYLTTIAATANSPTTNTQLIGYLNEIRIWNVAKTQAELKQYVSSPLPNPTTQPGLLAYYTFESLANKQGNSLYNITLQGNASINEVVPDCSFIIDSCSTITSVNGIGGVINDYTPVISFNPCKNEMVVEDASAFSVDDTVFVIQMKGAVIDSTNTPAFGDLIDYKNAGNYEFNYVKSVTGNVVELKNVLLRQYDIPVGKVQLVRVPYYENADVTGTLTCLPWDGKKGGVLVLKAKDTISLHDNIDVSAKGFLGGKGTVFAGGSFNCFLGDYYLPFNYDSAGMKGESITSVSIQKMYAKGRNAGGGGGGMNHNGGGGGGGNGGIGGNGGYPHINCSNRATNFCIGGNTLTYSPVNNKIFIGSGGGGGQANNGSDASGGNGGGLVILSALVISGNSNYINAQGGHAPECNPIGNPNLSPCHDGSGGGGAGGTVLIDANTILTTITSNVSGGDGANLTYLGGSSAGLGPLGPGAGGGGGVTLFKNSILPSLLSVLNMGGNNGVIINDNNEPWGSQPGSPGLNVPNFILPPIGSVFTPNIDSTRIRDSVTACKTIGFKGLAFINRDAIQNWQWHFGDNSFASTQNASHAYASAGNYNVKLVVTDVNGCKDSATKTITVSDCPSVSINEYAAVLSIDVCTNKMVVDDATKFNAGDTIVIMQMKGAAIDSSNSSTFGTISNYNNTGKYEFNYVKSKTGNTIEITNTMLNKYDAAIGRVQLIRVAYFQSLTVSQTLTCPAWDGAKGGVLILNSANDVTLNAEIDVSNKGFRGGAVGGGFSCNNIPAWAVPTGTGGNKGEGIADYFTGFEAGGARLANGGGGAYAANSGGGGGGNFGAGGLGGFHSNTCPSLTQSINGEAINYTNNNIVVLGGAGGGGQQDNNQPVAAGGNGGGIVIIKAATLNGNNQPIIANGENVTTLVRDEGGGGGGAGGSVLLYVNNFTGTTNILANGGYGSSNENTIYPLRCHGPGGGGGGGYVGLSVASSPGNISASLNGGIAGTVNNQQSACANTTNGASSGVTGGFNFNLVLPEATIPFKKNIDSVRINSNLTACKTFVLNGLGYTNTNPIQNWQWSFGDGGIDSLQNPSHTYNANGSNTIKLIATDINGCKDSASKIVTTSGLNFDFVFEQDACNPLFISFRAVGDTTAEIYWNKGDGTFVSDVRNPTHTYPGMGSYLVEYSTGNASTGCIDTVRKTIFVGWINSNIILTPDTTICYRTSKLLRSNIDSTLQFCWNPNNFLDNVNFANPTTSTPATITYELLAKSEQNNLVTNGDFSNGNSGFTSDYSFNSSATGLLTPGEYAITTSTINAGLNATDCKDHTTVTGNMLVGHSEATNTTIWQQQVNLIPNTNYVFSMWVQAPNALSKAILGLSINGNIILDSIVLPATTCLWKKYAVLWNAGNNTVARLAITDSTRQNTITGFDNFAIDDISFATYSLRKDSVKISVDTPFVDTRTDTVVCESVPVQLNTVGAARYAWSPATGLSNVSIASPLATPTDTTKYIVTGTSAFGCQAKDSVTISIKPKPIIASTGDTTICRNTSVKLFASGGGSYSWQPAGLLSNANIASPFANPTVSNTKYIVTVTGANSCINKDSFIVNVTAEPVFTISPGKSVCLNTQAQLNAGGGNYYLWSPASGVNNANIANPLSIATVTTPYSVLIRDTVCGADTTLATLITVLPLPSVTASKENDVNCAIGSTSLQASGALQYNWVPATGLNDANISSPVASPISTTTYTVRGTDSEGCSNTATVTVVADYSTKVSYSVPNAFTPNGNGKNDCFRVKYFGLIQALELMIYNRYGERVFYTTNANDCWDGTFKGNPCDAGNFVYYIKAKTTCGTVVRKGNVMLLR